ncbi:MAG: hypothetical protein IPJ26_00640 [Bacteroidetes bacterium]|jgi:hypothetical protein|nr:hypothetical protein [Bacteroidota bacterium]
MRSISTQFRKVTPVLLISWIVTTLTLLISIFVSINKDIELDNFTQDPNAQFNAPFYVGFFSNVGIMIWSAALSICFYGAWRTDAKTDKRAQEFLIFSGLITMLMTFDDLFQLHELVFPKYLSISENMVYLTYLNIYMIYFIRFRRQLLNSDFIVLGIAFFLLGLSTIIDILPLPIEKDTFLEDAIKLLGAITWLIYFVRTADEVVEKNNVK